MKLALSLVVLFAPVLARAALPPYAESTRRIDAVLSDRDVHAALGAAAWVDAIALKGDGVYEVRSRRGCVVEARVTCEPTGVQGPCELDVEVLSRRCAKP